MQLYNTTPGVAGYTIAKRPDGRDLVVVVVKGTFGFPTEDDTPRLAEEQEPLREADTFAGEPGLSAPVSESDFSPPKTRCDVLLAGSAFAPGGRPVERLTVRLAVGSMSKSFDVVGPRVWKGNRLGVWASPPERFTEMPISYANAFGGIDKTGKHPVFYPTNPAGVGFCTHSSSETAGDKPLPNTEVTGQPIEDPRGPYAPMAFGPIGRGWQPRSLYAGTYDDKWLEQDFPFLPSDFSDEYFQCAPADQQMEYPEGGERVELENLTPEGRFAFELPRLLVPVEFFLQDGSSNQVSGTIDTIALDTMKRTLTLTWRAAMPLRRSLFEVPQVVVGRMPRGWYHARSIGKPYYRTLGAFLESKR